MNAWFLVFFAAFINSVAGLLLKQPRVVAEGSSIAGNSLFGERLGKNQWLGIVLIAAGIVMASRGQ